MFSMVAYYYFKIVKTVTSVIVIVKIKLHCTWMSVWALLNLNSLEKEPRLVIWSEVNDIPEPLGHNIYINNVHPNHMLSVLIGPMLFMRTLLNNTGIYAQTPYPLSIFNLAFQPAYITTHPLILTPKSKILFISQLTIKF